MTERHELSIDPTRSRKISPPAFHEASAWVILLATLLIYVPFVWDGFQAWRANSDIELSGTPFVWAVIGMIILAIIGYIGVSIVLTVMGGDVEDRFDERDRLIDLKSDRFSDFVHSVGLLAILTLTLKLQSHFLIAYAVIGVMALGTIVKMVRKIIGYRWGI